jgi:Xaa-Pro aminopeptidase
VAVTRYALPLLAVFFLGQSTTSRQQPQYPVNETDKIRPVEFQLHRERIKAEIGIGNLAVLFTNPVRNRNNDVDFPFRGDSNFLYLTGFEEPDAALILAPGGFEFEGRRTTEALFVNMSSAMSETWLGHRMGPENTTRLLGIEAAFSNSRFADALSAAASAATGKKLSTVLVPMDAGGALGAMVRAFDKWRQTAGFSPGTNLGGALNRMREIKSPAEIGLLKKAAEISARAHVEAMRSIEPGMREWHIAALVQYIFAREGCEAPGYPPIVGSGPNSTILHYMDNRRLMKSGEIVCMDTAGEYHGYSADVTRSFPVSGRFSPAQRTIYDIVLRAQTAGIDLCKPGVTTSEISRRISQVLAEGLVEAGIIKAPSELGRYYMHGFGHGIGLDVHDPMPRTLAAGAVLTVEPGIYIKAGSPCDAKYWNIGIRIEDDILVTEQGPVNLSAGAPRQAQDIEKLMMEKGLGNVPLAPYRP